MHDRDGETLGAHGDLVDLLSSPGHLLRRAQQVHTELWARESVCITGPQFAILVAVATWPGSDQKQAGHRASLDKSTTAGVVGRLVRDGLIERIVDPADNRRRLLVLTPPGRRTASEVTVAVRRIQDQILRRIPTRDHDRFIQVLGQVARMADAEVVSPSTHGVIPDMARTPGHLIRRAQQIHTAFWNENIRDITGPQYAVLAAALRNGGAATHAQIGFAASLDSSSTRDVINRLRESGWLEAVDNQADRRSRPVRVTTPAESAVRLLRTPVLEVQRMVLDPLDEEERIRFVSWMRVVARVESTTG